MTSVDLPTLGRPTTATNPERNTVSRSPVGDLGRDGRAGTIRTRSMRRPLTRSATSRSPSTVDRLAGTGTWPSRSKTRPPTVSQAPVGRSASISSFTSSTGSRALTRSSPRAQALDGGLLHVELVDDLPHQLLDEVLQGDQAGGAAVLVDHHRLVELLGLHLAHQVRDPLGLGHEVGGPHVDADRLGPLSRPDGRIRSLV